MAPLRLYYENSLLSASRNSLCRQALLPCILCSATMHFHFGPTHTKTHIHTQTHTQDQYIFIHDAILESVVCGDTQIEASSLRVAMRKLKERSPQGGSGFLQQFSVSGVLKLRVVY